MDTIGIILVTLFFTGLGVLLLGTCCACILSSEISRREERWWRSHYLGWLWHSRGSSAGR